VYYKAAVAQFVDGALGRLSGLLRHLAETLLGVQLLEVEGICHNSKLFVYNFRCYYSSLPIIGTHVGCFSSHKNKYFISIFQTPNRNHQHTIFRALVSKYVSYIFSPY